MTWTASLYERVARRHYSGVYNYLCWLCGDRDLAQDLTQAAFVQAWRHPPEFRGESALRAWVYRVARNEYLQHRRRAGLETVALEDSLVADDAAGPDVTVLLRLERRELRETIAAALNRLPEIYREVVVLHNLEGLTLGQVAAVLEIPEGTVKSRRAQAFTLLRLMLAQENPNELQASAPDTSR